MMFDDASQNRLKAKGYSHHEISHKATSREVGLSILEKLKNWLIVFSMIRKYGGRKVPSSQNAGQTCRTGER